MKHASRRIALVAGPLSAAALFFLVELDPRNPAVSNAAGVALWMAIWWISEAIPFAATALLPVALFPLLGVMSGKDTAHQYFNDKIFLFIGGFLVALAMQRWELHRRIALRTLLLFGAHPRRILLGFMVATAFLSMWISNTATAMMMVPIALAVTGRMEEDLDAEAVRRYSVGVFLGVAYAASIGGIATLVGTPPNLSFARILAIQFEHAPEISFASWFLMALPITVLMLIVAWLLLWAMHAPRQELEVDTDLLRKQKEALGPMSFEERAVMAVFVSLALLWLFRADLRLGGLTVPGWSNLFPDPKLIDDGTVAMLLALVLFVVPSRRDPPSSLLDWGTALKLPWGIVLLFGGGFALAGGFMSSGLSEWLGQQLSGVGALPVFLTVVLICLTMTFLTELTSNLATTEMILPVLAGLSVAIQVNPLLLMIPATLSCSCAFMLPVATPPNAIVFGTERIRMADMVRTGITLNLVGVLVISAAVWFLGRWVFDIDLAVMPEWAHLR